MTDMRRPIDRELAEQRERERPLPGWLRALLRAHAGGTLGRIMAPGGEPGMTRAEWGMLLAGTSAAEESAFRYRMLGQMEHHDALLRRLLEATEILARRFPEEFSRIDCPHCRARLAALVVEEARIEMVTTVMRMAFMGITPRVRLGRVIGRELHVWQDDYERPHRRIAARLDEWVASAVGIVSDNYHGNPKRKKARRLLT